VEEDSVRSSEEQLLHRKETMKRGVGRGAPIRSFKIFGNFVRLPRKTWKRLLVAKTRVGELERKVEELEKIELERKPPAVSKEVQVASVALLGSLGVTDSKLPHVLATSSMFLLGKVGGYAHFRNICRGVYCSDWSGVKTTTC
jgi:hypothetical protein